MIRSALLWFSLVWTTHNSHGVRIFHEVSPFPGGFVTSLFLGVYDSFGVVDLVQV